MSLDFSFDKKSAAAILVGCILVGVLLFMAGFLVGRNSAVVESQPSIEKGHPGKVPAKTGVKPAAAEEPATAKPTANTAKSEQASSAPTIKTTSSPTLAPAASSQGASSEPQGGGSGVAPASAATPEQSAGATSEKAPLSENGANMPPHSFSVQFGAFQMRDKAQGLLKTLKSRGYPAFVFDTRDSDGRVWYTVRSGHYTSMEKAQHDAALFAGKEQMPTCVRSDNEL